MIIRTSFVCISLLCFVVVSIFGCARLTTTYSLLSVQDSSIEKVKALVDSTFSELGYRRGSMPAEQLQQSYLLWDGKNRDGVPLGYSFMVTYKLEGLNVTIKIEHRTLGADEDYLIKTKEHLNAVTNQLNKKLKDAHLNVTVQTDSQWLPALGDLP